MSDWNPAEVATFSAESRADCISLDAKIEALYVNGDQTEIRVVYNNGVRFTLNGATVSSAIGTLNTTIASALA